VGQADEGENKKDRGMPCRKVVEKADTLIISASVYRELCVAALTDLAWCSSHK